MKNHIKMDDLGSFTPIFGNTHMPPGVVRSLKKRTWSLQSLQQADGPIPRLIPSMEELGCLWCNSCETDSKWCDNVKQVSTAELFFGSYVFFILEGLFPTRRRGDDIIEWCYTFYIFYMYNYATSPWRLYQQCEVEIPFDIWWMRELYHGNLRVPPPPQSHPPQEIGPPSYPPQSYPPRNKGLIRPY